MKLYIAYGSNLHKQQMEKRCPDAVPHAVGTLNDGELVYRGVNPNRIYATLQQKEGASTPVVLWEITPKDETNLDEYEDYPTLYYKQDIPVTLTDGTTILAMVYLMTDQPHLAALRTPIFRRSGKDTKTLIWICPFLKHLSSTDAVRIAIKGKERSQYDFIR